MTVPWRALALALAFGVAPPLAHALTPEPGCAAPAELLEPVGPLPATARAIAANKLRVLIGGSASVLGPGTSNAASPWPQRLEAMLRARHPRLEIELVVKGARGTTAAESAKLLAAEAERAPADLIVWQTGTVEAARGLNVDQLVASLHEGLERLHTERTDLVLMDLQFSRFLRANAQVDPYLDAMRVVAAAHDVPLFRRYEIMQAWADADTLDLERAKPADRVAATDRLNDCLARALDKQLTAGLAEARRR